MPDDRPRRSTFYASHALTRTNMQREAETTMEPGLHDRTTPAALLEAEIQRLHARNTELEREKADAEVFAAMAAHELVAPLVTIDAYAALVSDRADRGAERRLAPRSRRAAPQRRRDAAARGARCCGTLAPRDARCSVARSTSTACCASA